jgi:hypothetical protein
MRGMSTSRMLKSEENLLRTLPNGVASKNPIGAWDKNTE